MTADELAEHLFDVANQLNRGAALLVDRDEKAQVATIDLRAGRKAKASAAYASACAYLAAGMALLDERGLGQPVRLDVQPVARTRGVRIPERELRQGRATDFGAAGSERASKIDKAAAYRLKIDLHVMKSENPQGRRQRAGVPAPVRHRDAGASHARTGRGRVREGLAQLWASGRSRA